MRSLCAAALCCLATPFLAGAPAALAADLVLTLENASSDAITTLYAAPPHAARITDHALALETLAPGAAMPVTVVDVSGCTHAVTVVFASGRTIAAPALDLCAGTIVSVHDDGIFLRP